MPFYRVYPSLVYCLSLASYSFRYHFYYYFAHFSFVYVAATQLPAALPLLPTIPSLCPTSLPFPYPPRDDTLGFLQFVFCIWPQESFALLSLLLLLLFCFLFKLYSKLLFKWQMVFCASPPPPPSPCRPSAAHLLCRRGSCGGIGTCHKPFVNRQPDWIP